MEMLAGISWRYLVIECGPCNRRGVYRMDRLRERFGPHALILDVYLRLTQTCRWQREVGSRTPNVYGTACRSRFELTSDDGRGSLPSRT